jgi:hypothetical protein
MAFIKGKTGNEKGRPVKTDTDSPEAMRNILHSILKSQLPTIKKDLATLKPRDRVMLFDRLCRYVLPGPEIDLSRFSEKDLDILITRIKTKLDATQREKSID